MLTLLKGKLCKAMTNDDSRILDLAIKQADDVSVLIDTPVYTPWQNAMDAGTLIINQSYWFEVLQTVIKSFEGWGQVIIFLLLSLTLLVFSVSISSVYKSS